MAIDTKKKEDLSKFAEQYFLAVLPNFFTAKRIEVLKQELAECVKKLNMSQFQVTTRNVRLMEALSRDGLPPLLAQNLFVPIKDMVAKGLQPEEVIKEIMPMFMKELESAIEKIAQEELPQRSLKNG